MQRETRTYLRYTLSKELKLTLNILLLGSNKSLLFLALACLKDLGVLVILSSKELLALVILSILRRIVVDNYATALLRA
ncbi:hypothetical protein HBH50_134220 [Parastagonospora nodorum]|nr:hypothetical protein HBH50_134220 [Parastagonospora nodorum]KAH4085334.1 hypothetical protein HBH48_159750 [Parastagonospora nodorum]